MGISTRIDLVGIEVFAHHGVHAVERDHGQRFVVDVRCGVVHPGEDAIEVTVDYAALAQRMHSLFASDPVDLIETVGDRLARACLEDARVEWAEVTVHKPDIAMPVSVADVSVTVRRVKGTDV